MWSREDFRVLLRAEQAKRKIPLGGWYVRRLTKIFDEHYSAAGRLVSSGDYVLARESLLKSISFPVYQNDVKLYRAVVLVMLQPYINDVIGKISVLNQHLFNERLSTQAQAIFKAYQSLPAPLDLRDWDETLRSIKALREQVASFGKSAEGSSVEYPPAFAQVDADIQAVIQRTAVPNPEKAADFKTLLVDLDLKEKVAKQNTAEALAEVQKQYEQALHFIEEKKWQEAYNRLGEITFPSELVEEARRKAAIIEKLLEAQARQKEVAAASSK